MPTTVRLFLVAILTAVAVTALAQAPPKQPSPPQERVAAKAEDVGSLDAIVEALYDVISGPAGQKRDWNRMRSLFSPEAIMAAVGKRPNGSFRRASFTVEEYVERNAKAMEESGFFEREIVRHVDQYGQIAQVFSSYEARRAAGDEKPFMRGINSLSLWSDGQRWWIVGVVWQAESADNPLPESYARGGNSR